MNIYSRGATRTLRTLPVMFSDLIVMPSSKKSEKCLFDEDWLHDQSIIVHVDDNHKLA